MAKNIIFEQKNSPAEGQGIEAAFYILEPFEPFAPESAPAERIFVSNEYVIFSCFLILLSAREIILSSSSGYLTPSGSQR